ncbi:MAG: peptidase M64 [Bacteroidales bacterium]|nr:peptidase M64 [Bacteroidales bacterium]
MKKQILFILFVVVTARSQAQFDRWFYPQTLRIDYIHAGNHDSESYYLSEVKTEPFWAGSEVNLADTFFYGHYYLKLFDRSTDSLIYSRGYSTLFMEWQTTEEAKTMSRAFHETVVMPLPKKEAVAVLFSRDSKGVFTERFRVEYHPQDYFIRPEPSIVFPSFDVHLSGEPSRKVDVVILPDGYTEAEMGLFISDCKRFADILFSFEPYQSYKDHFNIRGILAPSWDSGNDIPAGTLWKRTILNTSYYTFDSERYCMTYDNKSVRDLAANAPYDQIYILVNSDKYGGGAIYNHYSVCINGNLSAASILVHEFGHGFAGLGDEYYNSEVAYSDFYPENIEPWEPNLTTLIDFDKKWKNLLLPGTPIPTPASLRSDYKTGVYEGGGYVAKGVYRPAYDCLMNSFTGNSFCEVCTGAIIKMILFYSE